MRSTLQDMSALLALPDPGPWQRLAQVLADQAEAMRAESRRIVAAAARTHWHSPAARIFAVRAAQSAEQALRAAVRMDEAADLARRRAADLSADLSATALGGSR